MLITNSRSPKWCLQVQQKTPKTQNVLSLFIPETQDYFPESPENEPSVYVIVTRQ